MALSYKKAILLIEPEVTPGTLETFAAGDGGMAITEVTYKPIIGQQPRNIISSDKGVLASVPTTLSSQIDFSTEMKGGSAVDVAPKVGELLVMAGFTETINVAVDVQYALGGTTTHHSLALDIQDDGGGNAPRFASAGALANLVFSGNVGEFMSVRATCVGTFEDPVDVAALSPTLEIKAPPRFINGTFTIGGTALKVRSYSIDLGNNNILIPDINAASGIALSRNPSRVPTMTFEAELTTIATHDFIGLIKAGTENALVLKSETISNNTIQFDATKLQYLDADINNTDEVPVVSMRCQLNRGGTDELKITLN